MFGEFHSTVERDTKKPWVVEKKRERNTWRKGMNFCSLRDTPSAITVLYTISRGRAENKASRQSVEDM